MWANIAQARRERRRLPSPDKPYTIPFDGGLDLVSSDLDINPGQLIGAQNYEIGVDGGYEQLSGYRRFDGQATSAEDNYEIMPWGLDSSGPSVVRPQVGDVVVGQLSGASGTLIAVTDDGATEAQNIINYSEDFTQATDWDPGLRWAVSKAPVDALQFFDSSRSGMTINLNRATYTPDTSVGYLRSVQTLAEPSIGGSMVLSFYFKFNSRQGDRKCALFVQRRTGNAVFTPVDSAAGTPTVYVPLEDVGDVVQTLGVHGWFTGVTYLGDDVYYCQIYCSDETSGAGTTCDWRFGMAYDNGFGTYIVSNTTAVPTIGEVDLWLGGVMYVYYPFADLPVDMKYMRTTTFTEQTTNGKMVFDAVTSGPFTEGESLEVGGTVIANCSELNKNNNEPSPSLHASYLALANQAKVSALINAVPGSGSVTGVWVYEDNIYAFRNNSGGTETDMYRATSSGWTQITINQTLNFSAGSAAPYEGATLDGVASGQTAIIERAVVTGGSWSGGNASGYLVLNSISGAFINGETLNANTFPFSTANGTLNTITLEPDGRYEFRNYNFGGHVSTYRMYGVNGVDRAFEFDYTGSGNGTVFTKINTGMGDTATASQVAHLNREDHPNHIAVHQDQLWLTFAGGSVQHSSIGNPLEWAVVTGAGEIAVGDDVTGLVEETFDSLFILTKNQIKQIAGYNSSNYQMVDYSPNQGGREWSVQRIAGGVFFDDFGFTTLQSTQRFGNYEGNSVSTDILPLVQEIIETGLTVQASHIFRRKNRYRMFLSDKRFISMAMRGKKVAGFMICTLDHLVTCTCSEEETSTGRERVFFGADDGFVYEMESGNSFDGEPIEYSLRFPSWYQGGSTNIKKYSHLRLEGRLRGAVDLQFDVQYDNAKPDANQSAPVSISGDIGGGTWDAMRWDQFVWDEPTRRFPMVKLEGEGLNISLYLYGSTESNEPHTIRGATLMFRPRRPDRRTS